MTATDYQKMIDAETWAFIRETTRYYPPDSTGMTIAEQRAVYDRMCRAFHKGTPPGIQVTDHRIAEVPCRSYTGSARAPHVVYFHGGGFVVGGLHSHDDVCAEICAATGLPVTSVDYRLVPEHLHPAAFDDGRAVVTTLAAQGPLILVGDSAGGNLVAAICHALRPQNLPILGQLLIYPGLGGPQDSGSALAHAHAPMLTRADVAYYAALRHGGDEPAQDPTATPLRDTDFTALPPTIVHSAECDPLADDGRRYCDLLRAAGGQAEWVLEGGLVHGYLRARHSVGRARASFARICAGISRLATPDHLHR